MGSLCEECEACGSCPGSGGGVGSRTRRASGKPAMAREGLERLRVARETVADVLAEMSPKRSVAAVDAGQLFSGSPVRDRLEHAVKLHRVVEPRSAGVPARQRLGHLRVQMGDVVGRRSGQLGEPVVFGG